MADQQHQERCAFFLKRKQRFCKLVPGPGKKFCGEHANFAPEDETGAGRKRVNCPLDPNHTCYEDQLRKHLKKCNSRQKPSPLYIQKGVNSGLTYGQCKEEDAKISLHSMSTEELMSFVERVRTAYKDSVPDIPEAVLSHQGMKTMLEDPENGASALKHLKQQASLIGHLDHLDLLKSDVCFVEFGAGRGRLSHYVQMCLPEQAASHFIVIDRANTKHKFDKNIRRGEKGPDFERLKVDIEDLNLGLVPSMAEHMGPVAAISKHLCGAATDLTLRCLIETLHSRSSPKGVSPSSSTSERASREHTVSDNVAQESNTTEKQLVDCIASPIVKDAEDKKEALEDGRQKEVSTSSIDNNSSPPSKRLKEEDNQKTSQVEGILIALCCHHRCTWTSYVGKGFFTEIGFTEEDFHLLRSMSSWATCGFARGQTKNEGGNDEDVKESSDGEGEEEKYEQSKAAAIWTVEEREEIGRQCKRLLDQGRLWYLQQFDFHTQLVHYVEPDVSLENIAIVATRGKPTTTT